MMDLSTILDVFPEAVTKVPCRMPKPRAVGPDALAGEIWIAGGERLAELLS